MEFEGVETNMEEVSDEIVKKLLKDQRPFFKYIREINEGEVPAKLALQKVGPLNHSRWLTLATRILHLYTRTENPCDGLRKVTSFIMQVYGPSWYHIKRAPKFRSVPALLLPQMNYLKSQPNQIFRGMLSWQIQGS